VTGFGHPGPWRYFPIPNATLIGHNDIAPYNACFDGDQLAGVFYWDLAGPTTPLAEVAFLAWNGVLLWQDVGPDAAAKRLTAIAEACGGIHPRLVLRAVPDRVRVMLDGIPLAAADGDPGMQRLITRGEPENTRRSLDGLLRRIPGIEARLAA
jgi:hypothetical protein